MKIRVYLAFLIARLQMSEFNKKLYRQSKLLPVNKSRDKSSLNDCAVSFLLTFLGFFRISFDIGDVSNKLVTTCVIDQSVL